MPREEPEINCPRCGKHHVLATLEFCVDCRPEWEQLKESVIREAKAGFIADWDEDKN